MQKRKIYNYIISAVIAIFITIALMIREEMKMDFSQELLMTISFCAFAIFYYRLLSSHEKANKLEIAIAVIFALFKYCQLTKEINSEYIFFFKHLKNETMLSLSAIVGYSAIYYAIIRILYKAFNIIKKCDNSDCKNKYIKLIFEEHPVSMVILILFVLWLPHIIIQYPGAIAWDTDAEIAKFLNLNGEIFSSHFPVFHIWLVGIVISFFNNIGLTDLGFFFFTMLNIVIALGVFANTFRVMKEIRTPYIYRIICLVIYAILPTFIGHIIINVKDTVYSLAMVLLVTSLIKLQFSEKEFWSNVKEWSLYFIATILVILMRNNGIHIMVITAIAILVKIIKEREELFKRILITIVPIIVSELIIITITLCYNVTPGEKSEMYSFFIQQTSRYICLNKEDITNEEEEILRKTLAFDEIEERYDPEISDLVKDTFTELTPDYIKVYFAQLLKHPETYVDATLNMTYTLFVPDIIKSEYYTTIDSGYDGIRLEGEQIRGLAGLRILLNYYYKIYDVLPITSILSGYGTYNCLALIIIAYLIKENRKKELFVYIPIIATMGILILSPVACFRYCMPIVFSIPMLLGYYLKKEIY